MALTTAALNSMGNNLESVALYMSLHSANPGTTGTNETTAARKAITWTTTASGNAAISGSLAFTGGAANGACTYLGLWSASSGGTFYGGFALSGDQTFNASGAYTVTAFNIQGS